jgi:DNA-binding SARP family transcriptional activator/tetratricopeptide (TPR) repeat protein/DNA-binding XRE family transcriptional regulator
MTAANGGDRVSSEDGYGFAVVLREFRLASGLTQVELARQAGVGPGTVRDLEQGRRGRPRAASVAALARALDLTAAQSERLAAAGAEPYREPAHHQGHSSGAGLWVQVLGPVVAWRDGDLLDTGSVRRRAVLAVLALGLGEPVRREALVDALWPDGPPASAVNIVQGHVSALRRVFGGPGRGGIVEWAGESYRLRLGPAELDLLAFEELAAQAESAGDPVRACGLLERALGLWRGDVAQDVAVAAGHPAATALAARRAEVVVELARLAGELGEPERALPELRALAAREPLDERAHAWLMLALAGAGQQAAALEVFAVCRDRLDEELGVRPGPELARAHERVLRQEDLPAPPDRPHPHVPRQLPAAVRGFVGREAEMTTLASLLDRAAPADGAVLISAIGGTAGVGKTALAVHWAHQVADRFPGGQLYVNLRGYDPEQPVPAADALAGFLRALGVPGPSIPPGADERAALYRSLLAQRRVLVLLDNAGSVEQVRPLLPGAAACVVVVTSRDALAGLVARDGARRLELDLLPPGEAAGLLRELIGERAVADPAATLELAALCARLPLALRVAAEHVIARPAIPLPGLVAELAGLPRRLDVLDALADAHTGVRAVFSWSCQSLDAPAVRAYRLAGLHPGPDLDVYAAAALTGLPVGQAGRLMDQLVCAYLVQVSAAGRYGMHDLLRGYARELAAAQDSEQEQRAALSRLFAHYVSTASAAVATLYPAAADRLPAAAASAGPGVAAAPVGDPAAALAWLDAQRPCLVMSMAYMTEHGWPDLATRLARTLYRYLYTGSHVREGVTVLSQACRAAREAGDPGAEAAVLTGLAGFRGLQGRYAQAAGHLEQALGLARAAGEQVTQARALSTLGVVSLWMGRYEQAGQQAGQALEAWRTIGHQLGQAAALNVLGCVDLRQGRYEQGASHLTTALAPCS